LRVEESVPDLSVVVPARNEARWLGPTLDAIEAAARAVTEHGASVEVLVVDNDSEDGTCELVASRGSCVARPVRCESHGAARARNMGAAIARGQILVFVDADTRVREEALVRVLEHSRAGAVAGLCRLGTFDGGLRAAAWWTFWNQVRRLPIPRAKAMPAFMFCTRRSFDEFGPFDESVAIGEEWPILATAYARARENFVYDLDLLAESSSRRMQLQRFGYLRNLCKYGWAILHRAGRVRYADTVR